MTRITFELTMPNVGSWNGKFSGADNKYTVIKKLKNAEVDKLELKNYYYNFGDGWGANVNVKVSEKREKATNKFMGYEWMIESIIKNGKII